ncbi:MAG: glucose 1-dehydrogenase [Burkholderiales bacterium]|nr:glucose 1-dehydrogenase [Burkholderiales bacterium]
MKHLLSLEGKIAMVTGASSGLGENFAKTLARHGAKVVVTARRIDRLEGVVAAIKSAGGEATAIAMDVTDAQSVKDGFKAAEAAFGPMDIVVANAGVGPRGTSLDMTPDDWTGVIDANLNGVWYTLQEAARRMIATKVKGSIVTTASIMALRGRAGAPAYAASKAAVAHLTKVAALEFAANGIRVNALAPGYFETDLNRALLHSEKGKALVEGIPMKRTGQYSELDGALLLLASDAGSFMTGTVIPVDGGHLVNSL